MQIHRQAINGENGVARAGNWKQTLADDRGQTVIVGALCMTVLLGIVGLATDVGVQFLVKRSAQTAADAAAIAAAQEMNYSDMTTAARADAASNGFTNGSNGVTVAVNNPPLYGPHAGNSSYVETIVSRHSSTFFLSLFSMSSMTVEARAVGGLTPAANCIYTLGTSGTDLNLSNGASVSVPGCAVIGDSTSSSDLSVVGGASLSAGSINLVGGSTVNNGGSTSPAPTTGVAKVNDPLGYLSPPSWSASSCVANPNLGGGGTFTIGPATSGGTICYNGLTISNGATAKLNPGLYVINGTLTVAGGSIISGTGVTFYLPTGASLSISNGINWTLTAPTSGTWNGILFYQNPSNTTAESFEGGSSSVLKGILYFPTANITFENGSSANTYATFVASSLTFAGGATINNYALINPSTPITQPRLME